MFCFNEFAFTVQVKQKINSTQILGFTLICMFVFYDWPFPHMCTLQRMQPISLLMLGSFFSDCVVFYGDYIVIRPHCMHEVQRCGLLLPLWRGLWVCIYLSVRLDLLDTIMIWGLQKQISRSSAVWDVDSGGPENHVHVLGGGRIPTERGNLGASPTMRLFVNTIRYDTTRWAILACAQKLT